MIIGTAGHIDHGKTTLVKALTGIDTDRLKEEKARGISIDLGYAYVGLGNGDVLGWVDVPGHERFIHNMLAGATGIDFGLLLVAADDGLMPQTWEHFRILNLLGIARGAVALTKIDKVEPARIRQVRTAIGAMLEGTALAGSPVFPVSAVSGEGIDALRRHLETAASTLAPKSTAGYFRLAIDRCFTLAGSGTVVTGTVFSGTVRTGDKLVLSPSGIKVRVRSIHAQNRAAEQGYCGQRCALNIVGAEKHEIARGDWVLGDAIHAPTQRLDARLHLLSSETAALKHWTPFHLHLAAARRSGRVALLHGDDLLPGGDAYVQLVLDHPLGALHGDRFVLRDPAAQRTLGGGVILDPFAPARKRRAPARLAILQGLEQADRCSALRMMLQAAPDGLLAKPIAVAWNIDESDALGLWKQAAAILVAGPNGNLAFDQGHWQSMKADIAAALADMHRHAPQQPGVEPLALRRRATPQMLHKTFDLLIGALIKEKALAREGSKLRLATHQVGVSPHDAELWQQIEAVFNAAPLQPLGVAEIAKKMRMPETQLRGLLRHWSGMGRVYALEKDAFVIRHAVLHFARIAKQMAEVDPGGHIRLAEFRDRIQAGRRYAVKLLEFFDHIGFTLRVGDAHKIRKDAALLKEL